MRRYPVALRDYADRPRDEQDFQGSFRIGYSEAENALFLAVEMRDESMVDTLVGAWTEQDGCELYVDAVHEEGDVPVGQAGYGPVRRGCTAQEWIWPISRSGWGGTPAFTAANGAST
jgi:hypothetical protein